MDRRTNSTTLDAWTVDRIAAANTEAVHRIHRATQRRFMWKAGSPTGCAWS